MRGDPQNFWQGQRAASRYLSRRNSLFFRNNGRAFTQKKPLDRNSGLMANFQNNIGVWQIFITLISAKRPLTDSDLCCKNFLRQCSSRETNARSKRFHK